MKRGFTLIEMLVVIGIIAVLVSATAVAYNGVVVRAQNVRAGEQVHELVTALVEVMQKDDAWPRPVLAEGGSGKGEVTPEVGGALAKRGALSLSYREISDNGATRYVLSGPDKFGVLDPWAEKVVRRKLKSGALSLDTKVPTGGTLRDHRYRFAVDGDYDGKVTVSGDGISATIRASAVVWGAGRDGKFGTKDDLRSWNQGQEVK